MYNMTRILLPSLRKHASPCKKSPPKRVKSQKKVKSPPKRVKSLSKRVKSPHKRVKSPRKKVGGASSCTAVVSQISNAAVPAQSWGTQMGSLNTFSTPQGTSAIVSPMVPLYGKSLTDPLTTLSSYTNTF